MYFTRLLEYVGQLYLAKLILGFDAPSKVNTCSTQSLFPQGFRSTFGVASGSEHFHVKHNAFESCVPFCEVKLLL